MLFAKRNSKRIYEEGVFVESYSSKISKEQDVFYNPLMKLNRDISLLVIETFFDKPIKFCDPMAASGIREMRFLKTIPDRFDKIVMGDISLKAISDIKRNFRKNGVGFKKVKLINAGAICTIDSDYFDFIEVDPFGSPIPFLDAACQKIKHGGILSVTATDTAPLCGTYPKTCLRKYGIKVKMTYWHEELGVRNLIAYCQSVGARYGRHLVPIVSYSYDHYFKIFFKVEESRTKALDDVKKLKYIKWHHLNQEVEVLDFEEMETMGRTYVGPMHDTKFIEKMIANLGLIKDNKRIARLLDKLKEEVDIVGYYSVHKLQKFNKFESPYKFDEMLEKLREAGFIASKPHNNGMGIKTNASCDELLKIIEK